MSKIVIRSRATDEVAHEIDTSSLTEHEAKKAELGMVRKFDFERYYYEVVSDD